MPVPAGDDWDVPRPMPRPAHSPVAAASLPAAPVVCGLDGEKAAERLPVPLPVPLPPPSRDPARDWLVVMGLGLLARDDNDLEEDADAMRSEDAMRDAAAPSASDCREFVGCCWKDAECMDTPSGTPSSPLILMLRALPRVKPMVLRDWLKGRAWLSS